MYDKQVYFLPQLIASANTMETAIAYLEPLIKKEPGQQDMATIVIATVEGDVHDIGKNLVGLMLRNYGYKVVDLGKDVPAGTIIETALREKASVVGLSALMTSPKRRISITTARSSSAARPSRRVSLMKSGPMAILKMRQIVSNSSAAC